MSDNEIRAKAHEVGFQLLDSGMHRESVIHFTAGVLAASGLTLSYATRVAEEVVAVLFN